MYTLHFEVRGYHKIVQCLQIGDWSLTTIILEPGIGWKEACPLVGLIVLSLPLFSEVLRLFVLPAALVSG